MMLRTKLDEVNCLLAKGNDRARIDNGRSRLGCSSGRTRLLYILCIHWRGCADVDLEFIPHGRSSSDKSHFARDYVMIWIKSHLNSECDFLKS